MKFIDYKNILEKDNIILFDSYYRITYDRLINLLSIVEKNQYGGGNKLLLNPFFIIRKFNKEKKIELINLLLKNNKLKSLEICNKL
tara:strand:- start:579 stop:836 length:258 start_codon:yes stop_codon:yes gene_type:complete